MCAKWIPRFGPVSTAVGILGMTGLTAYFGVVEVCAVKPGDAFVVSGAAGAVGSAAGQIAKIRGARVIGIAGGASKMDYLRSELGFDAAIDYQAAPDIAAALRVVCPNRVDTYFDNVGGSITDAVLAQLNTFARVGHLRADFASQRHRAIRRTSHVPPSPGCARARVQGFLVWDFAPRHSQALKELAGWIASGQLKYREDVIEGFENMPKALIGLFHGENIGKRVVRVASPR